MTKRTDKEDIDFDALKHDINKLTSDVSKMASKLSELGKDTAENIKDTIVETSKETYNNVEKKLKQKPLVTVASAFGVGLLVGLISKYCSRK